MIKNPPIIKKVVEEMGGTIEQLIPERGYFYIKINGQKIFVSRKFKIAMGPTSGGEITKYKDLTYLLLKENNLPVPKTVAFYHKNLDENDINEKLKTLSFPIVIKDAAGSQSNGVFTNIKTIEEAKKILNEQMRNYRSMIAQEMIHGKEFRILVLGNRLIGALELIPPRIFGDGKKSVKELIEEKQEYTSKKTPLDDSLDKILEEQGESISNIPKVGKEIYIRKGSVLAEGGETRDVTELVNTDIINTCIKASLATDKYLAGMDIMCEDISKKVSEQEFNILEINGKPDVYIHYNPTHGQTRDVIREIITFILKLKRTTFQ